MEAELTIGGLPTPGLAPREHGLAALAERESDCFSGTRPFNLGLFHTGCEGGPKGKGERTSSRSPPRSQAVAEGNYGRPREQRRYTDANAEAMFSEPHLGPPDEQPGALPEILPSPDFSDGHDAEHRPLLDLPLDVHAGLGPLRHRLAGHPPAARRAPVARRPDGSRSCPSSRAGQTRIGGQPSGSATARPPSAPSARAALHDDGHARAATGARPARRRDAARGRRRPRRSRSTAARAKPTVRETNRGVEVTVPAPAAGRHTVVVTVAS